jgi:hypothetical protein
MRKVDKSSERKPNRSAFAQRSRKRILLAAAIYLCLSGAALAQTPDSQDSDSEKSWTATTESKEDNTNPTRTIRSHTQNGNRTVNVQSLQARGPDGNLNPYQDIETETVQVNATTTRTTIRTFVRDSSGTKTLFQITEEEKRDLPGGDSKVVRTTSNPDANGNLQVVQRENQETRKTSPDSEETKTTVMLPSINGGLSPAMQTEERQKHSGNKVEIQKTTLLPDSAGSWRVAEVRHTAIEDEGKSRTKEERVSRPDPEGTLSEVSRTVSRESSDGTGDSHKSEETYSIDQPGAARDGGLHLIQRVTTTQRTNPAGQQTTKVAEQPNPGDPGAGLSVSTVTNETVRLGPAGAQATETIQLRDANGSLDVISVDTTKADSARAVEVQIAPSKPK